MATNRTENGEKPTLETKANMNREIDFSKIEYLIRFMFFS